MKNKKGQFIKGSISVAGFKKNHIPWNKGVKGIHLSPETEFKKGNKSWNEGTKGIQKAWNKGLKGCWGANKGSFKKGQKPHNWKGGRKKVTGYIYLYNPNHPYNNQCYVAEHRLMMEKFIGRFLNSKEIVHHIDGNKENNNIENLMLFPNISSHHRFRHINEQTFICKFCGKSQKDL